MSISINFHGVPLIVTGIYYKAKPASWNAASGTGYEGDDAQFYYDTVKINGFNEMDIESLLTKYRATDDLEAKCVSHIGNL